MNRTIVAALAVCAAWAQDVKMPDLSRLASKAADTVEVNLDGALLGMATKFLDDKDDDEAKAKQLLTGLKGVYVRQFKFAKPGEYANSDIDAIRSQLQGPAWSRVVDVKSSKPGGDNAGVYIKTEGDKIGGIVVIAAEPRELTVVNIVGTIDPERIHELGGKLGIPNIPGKKSTRKQPAEKQEEE